MVDTDATIKARRLALIRAMDSHGLNPATLAQKSGLKSANLLYNFLNGVSNSLSILTYQKIIKAMPGVTIPDLLGEKVAKRAPGPILVKTYCQAGHLREQFSFPAGQMRELPLPVEDSARQAGAWAAIVRRPGAEEIYPEKTILLCMPMARFEGAITHGRRVVVERFVDSRIEVTVREVREDQDGKLWLYQRSTDPKLSGAVKMATEVSHKPWTHQSERYAIAGVVIGAFIPEG